MSFVDNKPEKVYEPTQWQLDDLELMLLREDPNSANWSEMGCYKTTTLEWLLRYKLQDVENPRVLVITTKSGKGTYFQTLPEVLPEFTILNANASKVTLFMGGHEFKYDIPSEFKVPTVVLAHYNIFTKRKPRKLKEGEVPKPQKVTVLDKLLKIEWDAVVLDEAHRIKERETGWTKNVKKLRTSYRHVMTGTGFINNPAEIWSLFNFLDRRTFTSYWKFREKFCLEEITDEGFRKVLGIKPEMKDEFRKLVRSFGPRRTKVEVFKNLPHPIYTPVEVELNPTQRKMYNEIKFALQTMDENGVPISSPNVLSALQRLRQITVATPRVVRDYYDEVEDRRKTEIELVEPSSKLDALMEILHGLEWDEERKDQVVVFSNFRDPITLAKRRFDQAGISYIHMEQKDSDQTRYQKWAIDFPKREHQVFICTLQLGSESISLTTATTCIFLDRSWSPKDNSQGESRVWRPGQESVANMIHINAKNTTDERVLKVNEMKMGWFMEIFGEEDVREVEYA